MNLRILADRASKLLIDNSPHILTAIGVVGTASTAYLAGKASWQAADLIRLTEGLAEEAGEIVPEPRELAKQRVELVWKLYIPPAVMLTATAACIIAANRVSASRAAGIATAYTLLEKNFADHKDHLVEKLGERRAETFYDEVAQKQVTETWEDDIPLSGLIKGEVCYDSYGGQYFTSTVEDIRSAVNTFNARVLAYDMGTLADFYRLLDIDTPAFSESLGWNSNRMLEVRFSSTLIHETRPCITMTFVKDPLPDYGRFH